MDAVNMLLDAEDKRITVGLVIGQLSIGGAERQLYELATSLQQSYVYRPVVICHSNYRNPNGFLLEKEGVHVIYLDIRLNYVSKLFWIRKQLLKNHCRIAYAFLNPTNVYCWLACLHTDVVFIASIRGVTKLNFWLGLGLKFALAGSRKIIANSDSGKKWAVDEYQADPKKIVTIANAVRPINYNQTANRSLRMELDIADHDTAIGLVSVMKAQKIPGLMLEVAIDILNNYENIHFVWVGDGPLFPEILAKYNLLPTRIKRLIHFVGAKENPEDWFSAFNIFMLTSKFEGLSNALMEAMSLGLPCICSDVPGITDFIMHNQTGILVSNNKTDWVKNLVDLMQNPELARSIGQNASVEMLSYSPEILAKRTSAVFGQVLF